MQTALSAFSVVLPLAAGAGATCTNHDSPNPISSQYPNLVSGNLNGTTMIIPIPVPQARQLVPKQWPILQAAYQTLLPDFPDDMYPMMATAVHDHDIRYPALDLSMPDFSVRNGCASSGP